MPNRISMPLGPPRKNKRTACQPLEAVVTSLSIARYLLEVFVWVASLIAQDGIREWEK